MPASGCERISLYRPATMTWLGLGFGLGVGLGIGLGLGFALRWHLQPDEHAPDVGAVVAVVEERDVPARTEAVEELGERAGPEYVYMCVLRWPTLPVRVEK